MAIETTHYVYFSYHFKVIWKNIHLYLSQTSLWKILKEMGIPDYLTCLLRNLYAGQEVKIRTRLGTTDWLKIGKGVHEGCILSPCFFNLYAEYSMGNARLGESKAGSRLPGEISITSNMQVMLF